MAGNPNLAPVRKRRREHVNVDVKLVEIYEDLANNSDEIRLKAAHSLVSRFTADKTPTDDDIEKVLTRLFRGLCSGRKSARIGFSVALTEVLSQVFARDLSASRINVSRAIEIWQAQSTATGDLAGQEEREYAFGRLFGAEALIKSRIVFNESVPSSEWTNICNILFDLSKKKPWLREECGWVIYCAIRDIAVKQLDIKYAQCAIDLLVENSLAKTPEGVAIWLLARDVLPDLSFPENVWQHGSPLDRRERATLAKIMKETSASDEKKQEDGKSKAQLQTGSWNPKLHFAWDAVLVRLYQQPPEGEDTKKSKSGQAGFTDFWIEVVDNGLFAAASSDERKYWGFLLFCKVLTEASTAHASVIFTKNLLRCMMNQLAVEDRFLHRIAVKATKTLQTRASKDPEFVGPAVSGLMGPNGAVNFDQITKTKTIEKIVATASAEAVRNTLPLFERMIVRPGTDDVKAANAIRQGLAGLLHSIVRSQTAAANNVWSEELQSLFDSVVQILSRFGYFKGGEKEQPEPAVTEQTQENSRNKVISCLNVIISGRQNPALIPYSVVKKIHDQHESGEWGNFLIEMDETIQESVDSAFKTLKKLVHKEKSADQKLSSSIQALKLIYSMTLLQVYSGDADAVSMLDDLKLCYTRFLGKKAEKEGADDASDAMVEILLSFASKGSQLFRKTSEQVFEAFAEQVTATGLQSMISILEAKDNLSGQQEMFENQEEAEEGEEGDVDMMDVDMDSDDDDVEEVLANEASSDEEEDDEGSDEDGEDEDSEELEAFDSKLAEALGINRAEGDDGASEDDDADMNDDEMEALDEQIVKVFRTRNAATSKKKDKVQAKETMINFKNRVLDLLHIYVKKCHLNPIALDLLLPLLQLSRRSTNKQIATRAGNVLREYTKNCKGASVPAIEASSKDDVFSLLKNVHQEATYSGPPSHSTACSQASLLLVKVLAGHDRSTVAEIVDVYGETRKKQLVDKRCHVQPSFFSDWNNWCVTASKQFKS